MEGHKALLPLYAGGLAASAVERRPKSQSSPGRPAFHAVSPCSRHACTGLVICHRTVPATSRRRRLTMRKPKRIRRCVPAPARL